MSEEPVVIVSPPRKYINRNKYPVIIRDDRGTSITINEGKTIEGDWYERFVGPKFLTYFTDADAKTPIMPGVKKPELHPLDQATRMAPRHMDKTKPEWVKSIKDEDINKYSKGQLFGIADFLSIPLMDGNKESMVQSLRNTILTEL